MEKMLWLGTAKVDITPKHPVPLAGFASRSGPGFDGVSHPLYARIFWFRHTDDKGRETTALLVSADLIWWGSERIPLLKKRIREKWGISEDAILFHGTHSHSGPQTSDLFSDLLGKCDPTYVEFLEETVCQGIERAAGNQEAVTVEVGRSRSHIGINRRLMVDGLCYARANKNGPFDPELTAIRFRTVKDRIKGILVHYGCHPTVTPDNFVSSEFCGVAMDMIERKFGDRTVSAYLQGCCADINPVKKGELFFDGTDNDVRRFGKRIADAALRALNGPQKRLDTLPLTARLRIIGVPLQTLPSRTQLEALVNEPWVKGEWSRKLLASPERVKPELPLEIVTLSLAEGLTILATNSEIMTEYGLFVKEQSAGEMLPIGYTNGMIGYIPTARQLDEGGYEAVDSTEYFLNPAPFDHAVEPLFRSAILDMIRN